MEKEKFSHVLKNKAIVRNELFAGLMLFLISFASIQITANLLTSGYENNQSHVIRPILLFMIPLLSGLLTMVSGYFLRLPFVILPNMMVAILTVVYGRIYLGYSLINVFLSVLLGTVLFLLFSFFIKEKNWKHWIPEPFINVFPFVTGGILVFFGLFKSGILASVNSTQVATTLGSSISMVDSQIPVFLGYLWNPLTLLVFFGICLYFFFQKQYPKYSLLIAFLIITIVGFFVPMKWGSQLQGNISGFNSFGFFGIKKEGFLLLFSNFLSPILSSLKTYLAILSQSLGLLKLSLLVFITLAFQNFYIIHSLDKLSQDKNKASYRTNKKGQPEVIDPVRNLPYKKLTTINAFSSLLGVLSNTTTFSYAQESAILFFTGARGGLSAVFCGLLLLFSAFLSPLGIFTSQAGTPMLFIVMGLTLVLSQIKQIRFETMLEWFPGFLFILISVITMNPVEGLIVGIIFYILIAVLNNLFSTKETVKIYPALWISLAMAVLFIMSQIYIEP
jgi:AGZA family xanthine/uracil permease-like MFS transporter